MTHSFPTRPSSVLGDTTTPTTPTPQRSDSAYQPHPDTLGFLVRCMTAMVSEGTLTPQVLPDAYRLATLATQLLKKSAGHGRSEEHTSELQSLMRISYAVFCLNKNKQTEKVK